MKLEYIPTDEQVADILSKALPWGKHVYFRDKMSVVRNTFLDKREFWNLVPEDRWFPKALIFGLGKSVQKILIFLLKWLYNFYKVKI